MCDCSSDIQHSLLVRDVQLLAGWLDKHQPMGVDHIVAVENHSIECRRHCKHNVLELRIGGERRFRNDTENQ